MIILCLPEPPKLSFAVSDFDQYPWEQDLALHFIACQGGKSSLLFVAGINGFYERYKALFKWQETSCAQCDEQIQAHQ